jgi:hypothetical protein
MDDEPSDLLHVAYAICIRAAFLPQQSAEQEVHQLLEVAGDLLFQRSRPLAALPWATRLELQ